MTQKILTLTVAALSVVGLTGSAFADSHGSHASREPHGARVEGHAVPRADVPHAEPRYESRSYYRGYDRPVVVAPRAVRPYAVRPYVVRPYYARPYVFRPRVRLGIGLFVGYPVPFAYAYPYPVPVYGYGAPAGPVIVQPGSTVYGGVSLEINPGDASVYVDGGYAGLVRDFDGTRQTLTLTGGRHRIEISAPGYETMSFDVDVVPGQIVPYQGDLRQY